MYLTHLGFLVVPLGILLLFAPVYYLIAATIVFAPFGAASVLNVNAPFIFGVQPGLYLSGLLVVRILVSLLMEGRLRSPRVDPLYLPLIGFLLYSVLTSLLLPRVFAGTEVFPPRKGLDSPFPQPLEPSTTNLTQAVYLLSFGTLALTLAAFLGRAPAMTVRLIRLFLKTFWVVAFLAFYDVFSQLFNLPSLVWLFENPMYGRLARESLEIMSGVVRPEASFPEPSVLCQYLVGILSCALGYCIRVKPTKEMILIVGTSSLIIALTMSATGILGAGLMLVVCLSVGRDLRRTLIGAAAFLAFCLFLLAVLPELGIDVFSILNKGQTLSFEHRTRTDLNSAKLLVDTFGLGVGLGSNRSSSLLLTLASNVGGVGLALAVMTIARFQNCVSFLSRSGLSRSISPEAQWLLPIYLGFVGNCVAGAIAVPDLSSLSLWLPFALGISLVNGVRAKARSSGRSTMWRLSVSDGQIAPQTASP